MKSFLIFILFFSIPILSAEPVQIVNKKQSFSIHSGITQVNLDCKELQDGGFEFCDFKFVFYISTNVEDSLDVSGSCYITLSYGINTPSELTEEKEIPFNVQGMKGDYSQNYELRFDFNADEAFHVKIPHIRCSIMNYNIND